jgi:hypothetical protein
MNRFKRLTTINTSRTYKQKRRESRGLTAIGMKLGAFLEIISSKNNVSPGI